MGRFFSKRTFKYLSIGFILIFWYLGARSVDNPHLLPTPIDTLKEAFKIVTEPGFLSTLGSSLSRSLIAILIASVTGMIAGFLSGRSPVSAQLLNPLITILRSTPVISVILLALIWLTPEQVPVFTGLLIMFPIIYSSISLGVAQTDPQLLEMAKVFNCGKLKTLKNIYVPHLSPFFFEALSTAFGIGWKAIIASEVLSQPTVAVGTEMQNNQIVLNVPGVAGWTLIALIVASILETLLKRSSRYFKPGGDES